MQRIYRQVPNCDQLSERLVSSTLVPLALPRPRLFLLASFNKVHWFWECSMHLKGRGPEKPLVLPGNTGSAHPVAIAGACAPAGR